LTQLSDILDSNFISKMFEEAEIGFWVQEYNKWEISWTNEKFNKILKTDPQKVIGTDIREYFDNNVRSFLASIDDYQPKIIETKGVYPNNRVYIQLSVGIISKKYLYGVIRDITQEKQAFRALKKSEKRLNALIEATRAGVIVINPEGLIVFSNLSFAKLLGYNTPEELIGTNITNFISEHEMLLPVEEFVMKKIMRKDGIVKNMLISVDSVFSGKNEMESIGIVTNISQELSDQLIHQKMLNEFLQITIHEMGTPITLLKGFIELLRKNYDQGRGYSDTIITALLRNTKILERQLTALRDVQDVQEGIFSINKSPKSFDELKNAIKSDLSLIKGFSRIKFELKDHRETDNPINLDLDRIMQLIYNLVKNACSHSSKNTDVLLEILIENDTLQITVSDEGVGIPKDRLNDIFKPFFSKSTQYFRKSMGLGLYITKTIVENHDGNISVDSMVGKGSKFTITIPI